MSECSTSAGEPPNEKVFRVNEAQKAIDSATRKLGLPRITHHDLRHLFAAAGIEGGVDIPTVSRWLGHKDGGALAMKTYGHFGASIVSHKRSVLRLHQRHENELT